MNSTAISAEQSDPMDRYSKPLSTVSTEFSLIFTMEPRANPDKPGRVLHVAHDDRFPLVPDFRSQYSYFVVFQGIGEAAGNHFHQIKEELFVPIVGDFQVYLQDPESAKFEEFSLSASANQICHIPAGIAHRVEARSTPAVLLVHATAPNINGDEFHYEIKPFGDLSLPSAVK